MQNRLGTDETALVERARRRDSRALTAIYQSYADTIYRYIYFRVGDGHVAEDLTSEVFMRMLESIDHYEPRGVPFLAWLYRIAQARVADYWRKTKRGEAIQAQSNVLERGFHTDGFTDALLTSEHLRNLMHQLTEEQKQVVVLRFFENLSTAEIALVMEKTEGAVKALQHRALRTLGRLMDGKAGAGES